MRSFIPSLFLVVPLACARPEEGAGAQAQVQALQAATEALTAARTTFEADRTTMQQELAALREAVDAANAKLEVLELLTMSRPQPRPAPPGEDIDVALPSDPAVSRVVEDPAALAAAVRCETEARCTVERSYLETLLINPGGLAKQARLVPKNDDEGRMLGLKLYGIRPGSFFKALGFKNGDMVRSINGHALGSMEQTLELYTKLRREKTYTLELERRGGPFTLTIEIVGGA